MFKSIKRQFVIACTYLDYYLIDGILQRIFDLDDNAHSDAWEKIAVSRSKKDLKQRQQVGINERKKMEKRANYDKKVQH